MATFHALEVRHEALNASVTQEVSKYSQTLRNRLGEIADFKDNFYKAFEGFVENDLPKDDLYNKLEQQIIGKKKKPEGGAADPAEEKKEEKPILPDVHNTKEQ